VWRNISSGMTPNRPLISHNRRFTNG
jgi:hypothetical protein